MYGYARVSVREPGDKNLDLQVDRLTHHVHILEMNGESYRLKRSRENAAAQAPDELHNP